MSNISETGQPTGNAMNNLIPNSVNRNESMSSTEIAQLTGKEHKNVIADIRIQIFTGLYEFSKEKMAEKSAINEIQGVTVIFDNRGYWSEVHLDREHTLTLITGYDVKARHAINKRWLELEGNQKPKTALELAKEQVVLLEEIEQANLKIKTQQKTISVKDDLIKASNEASIKAGEILIREFVKSVDIIDLGEKQFFAWMRGQKIVFLNGDEVNEPYQPYIKAGYFTWRPTEIEYGGKYRYRLRVTPRGKVWLAAKYMAYIDTQGLPELIPGSRNGLVVHEGRMLA